MKGDKKTTKIYKIHFHQPIKYKTKKSLLPYQNVTELNDHDGVDIKYLGNGEYLIDDEFMVHESNVVAAYIKPLSHPNLKK